MKKLKIGVDFDNVLSNSTEIYLKIYNHMFKENKTIEDMKYYDVKRVFQKEPEILESIWKQDFLWNNIKPIKGGVNSLEFLNKYCELYIVTASYLDTAKIKLNFIIKYFPFIQENQIIIIKNKNLLELDYLIDDYEYNLINGKYIGLLFDYPWNKNFNENNYSNIKRIYKWEDVVEIIKGRVEIDSVI